MVQEANVAASVRAAGLGALVWRPSGAGPLRALGVVPLLLGDQPAVALPWAYADQARSAAASDAAALVLAEPRLAGRGWVPLAAVGTLTLVEDGDGSLFTSRLLDQELRKHPPARALADSNLVRREHWWYLPRLVLLLDAPVVSPIAPQQGPLDAVLAVDGGTLHVQTVRLRSWDDEPLAVQGGPTGVRGPALLVGQEVSVPDAERWTVHVTTGHYDAGSVDVVERPPTRELEPVPGLLTRIRRQRALERACIRALHADGHA